MNYQQLGKSSLQISRIGFGCMSLGNDDAENERMIHHAIDAGINFFDTADMYEKGLNETKIGKILKRRRDEIYIATKVGNQWRNDGSGWDWNPRKAYIIKALEESLKRLQTSHIDLYQLHGGTLDDPIEETIDAFETLQQQGKIRYYGISSIRPNVIREYVRLSHIVSMMMQYSLLDRRPEETCLDLLKENNIGVLARGAVAKGLLVNKPAAVFLNYDESQVGNAAHAVAALSGENRSAAQTALQFALQNPAITSAVVGIRNRDQLQDAIGTMNTGHLTPTEMETLQSSIPENKYLEHR